MRYLKTYKLFEDNTEDIKDNINDILTDLADDSYEVEIEETKLQKWLFVYIALWHGKTMTSPVTGETRKVGELFTWDDIKDPVERLLSYLDSIGLEYGLSMIDSSWTSHPFVIKNGDFVCIKDNGKECQKCKYESPHIDLDKNIGSFKISICKVKKK